MVTYHIIGEGFVEGRMIITCNQTHAMSVYTAIHALGHFLSRIIAARWEGMGDEGSARYEPALLAQCPIIRIKN